MNEIRIDQMSDIRCFKFTPYKPLFLSSGDMLQSLEKVLQVLMFRPHPSPLQKEFLLGMKKEHQYFLIKLPRWS